MPKSPTNSDFLRVEFHCHTEHSRDSLTNIRQLLAQCEKRRIDRLVVTDHNTIRGAQEAKALDPERVIVGEEIMTLEGEILAAYVRNEIPQGLPAQEAIERLRAQDAFIGVSHPFDRLRSGSWKLPDLLKILPLIDAIETFNARCFPASFNQQAVDFARGHNMLGTAGSDAHALFEVGKATMIIPPFENARELKRALPNAQFDVALSPVWVRLTSRYAVLSKKLRGIP